MCGFEAFINGKHVIGKVRVIQNLSNAVSAFSNSFSSVYSQMSIFCPVGKEKEQARKEYKQA